jgi:hypothetical protein
MSAPIPLRLDFDATMLRSLAKKSKDGPQADGFWPSSSAANLSFTRWRIST